MLVVLLLELSFFIIQKKKFEVCYNVVTVIGAFPSHGQITKDKNKGVEIRAKAYQWRGPNENFPEKEIQTNTITGSCLFRNSTDA